MPEPLSLSFARAVSRLPAAAAAGQYPPAPLTRCQNKGSDVCPCDCDGAMCDIDVPFMSANPPRIENIDAARSVFDIADRTCEVPHKILFTQNIGAAQLLRLSYAKPRETIYFRRNLNYVIFSVNKKKLFPRPSINCNCINFAYFFCFTCDLYLNNKCFKHQSICYFLISYLSSNNISHNGIYQSLTFATGGRRVHRLLHILYHRFDIGSCRQQTPIFTHFFTSFRSISQTVYQWHGSKVCVFLVFGKSSFAIC